MSNLHLPKSRITASVIHLLLSATLLVLLIGLVAFIWYPGALVLAGGAEQGLKIVIAVDLILGPLLTLVIYNILKPRKELIRDLAIIAIFQLSCLFVGMSLVYEQRPLIVVHSGSEFYILDQMQLESHNIELATLESIAGSYPKVIFEKPPENKDEYIQYSISKSPYLPLTFRSDLWVAFPQDKLALEKYFLVDKTSNCINAKLVSYNQIGSACLNVNELTFSEYNL